MLLNGIKYVFLSIAAGLLIAGQPSHAAYGDIDLLVDDLHLGINIEGDLVAKPPERAPRPECKKKNKDGKIDGEAECKALHSHCKGKKDGETFICRCTSKSAPDAPIWRCTCKGGKVSGCEKVEKKNSSYESLDGTGGIISTY